MVRQWHDRARSFQVLPINHFLHIINLEVILYSMQNVLPHMFNRGASVCTYCSADVVLDGELTKLALYTNVFFFVFVIKWWEVCVCLCNGYSFICLGTIIRKPFHIILFQDKVNGKCVPCVFLTVFCIQMVLFPLTDQKHLFSILNYP